MMYDEMDRNDEEDYYYYYLNDIVNKKNDYLYVNQDNHVV